MKELDEETIEILHQAHMAGQAEGGIDPSYSNAQAYVRALSKPEFAEGEVYAYKPDEEWRFNAWNTFTNKDKTIPRRRLTQKEHGPYLIALVDAVAEFVDKRAISFEMLDELSRRLDAYNEGHADE